ncbi:MAG: preprotein translocase subunit SecE [Patescibacteria group bacterium]|nr:preprotein translocase subunit SecE [Patescibacteria group bacterium]
MIQKLKSFIHESRREFRKVNWPTKQETTRFTIFVVGFSLAVAAFLGLLDFIFIRLLKGLIL